MQLKYYGCLFLCQWQNMSLGEKNCQRKKKKGYKDISSAEYESICVTYKCMLVGLISLTAVGLLKVTHEYLLK